MHPLVLPLLLTLVVQGLIAFCMLALPVLLPAYAAELRVGAPFSGTVTAAVYGGAAITATLLSSRVRSLGAVRICQAALLSASAGLGLAATGTRPALLAGALAIGLGYGPVTAASALLLTRAASPSSYGMVFSVNRISIPMGAAAAGALLPLLSGWMGWRATLQATALLCAALAVVLQATRELDTASSAAGPSTPRVLEPLRQLFVHPHRRVLTQASLALLAAQSCLAAFTVTFLVEELSLPYLEAGAVFAAAQLAGVVARLSMGYVSDRLARRTAVIGAIGLATATATGLAAVAGPGWHAYAILALFLLYGAGALGWNGVLLAELVQTVPPERSGEIAGASAAIAFAGAVAGPALFSSLLGLKGYAGAYAWLSLVVLACSIALIRFDLRHLRARASQP